MSLNKKVFLIIFSSFCLSIIATNFSQAQTNQGVDGCCKTLGADGVPRYTNTKQAACTTTTGNTFVSWDQNMKSSELSCVAKDTSSTPALIGDKTIFTPQVTIPSSSFTTGKDVLLKDSTQTLIDYIIAIFKYATGIIGIIAAIVLMIAGVMWLTAGGNATAVSQAKTYIISSLTGLILTFCSFLLLSTINNSLVNLDVPAIKRLQYIAVGGGCCLKTATDGTVTAESAGMSKDKCTAIKKDYQTTSFFENYVADGTTCKSTLGCCRLSFGRKSGFLPQFPGADILCIDSVTKSACSGETSATILNYIPYNFVWRKDVSMDFYQTELCKDVDHGLILKDKCLPAQTCSSQTACQKMIGALK